MSEQQITSGDVKNFLSAKFGIKTLRVRTIPCKAKWIEVWIPHVREGNEFIYKEAFPEDFRRTCLGVIYGENSELAKQSSAGNVNSHSISMIPREWAQVISKANSR